MTKTGIMASPAVIHRIKNHKTGSQTMMPMKQGTLPEGPATVRNNPLKAAAAKTVRPVQEAITQEAATVENPGAATTQRKACTAGVRQKNQAPTLTAIKPQEDPATTLTTIQKQGTPAAGIMKTMTMPE